MRTLLVAVQFLTRIPISIKGVTERDIGRSALLFPVVGALVGGALAASYYLFSLAFPPLVARALPLVVLIFLSGAFHLDGLGDTVDALYGGKDREDALRIMKDPHLGAMGVIGIVTALFLKAVALFSLPESVIPGALLLFPVVGHAAMVGALALPYARAQGLGRAFANHRSSLDPIVAALVAVLLAFALLKIAGFLALLPAALGGGILLGLAWRKLKGVTGDVCGAVNEIAETAFLLALTAFVRISYSPLERVLPASFWSWHL